MNTVVLQELLQARSKSSSSMSDLENEVEKAAAAPTLTGTADANRVREGGGSGRGSLYKRRSLSNQLPMRETMMEAKWGKRRRQILKRNKKTSSTAPPAAAEEEANGKLPRSLVDEDLDDLKGSIELGFVFNEEEGAQDLCGTLPALNLYFAVNRQANHESRAQTPTSAATTPTTIASSGSPPRSPNVDQSLPDPWQINHRGDSPDHMKTKLRHWAQAVSLVALSLQQSRQSCQAAEGNQICTAANGRACLQN